MVQIDIKHCLVKVKDGGVGSAQNSLTLTIGEGNVTYTERRNMEYTLDRGNLDEVREGDQVPVEVSLDATWEYLTATGITGAEPTFEDAVKQRGPAAGWVSSDSDTCRPYAVDIVIEYVPPCSGSGVTNPIEIITLSDFRWEEIPHDLREGTISVSGQCNVTEATLTRTSTTPS